MATPQELAAQIQIAQGATQTAPQTAPVSTAEPVQIPTTAPVVPVNTATPEAPKTGATDNYLNLGKGKVVKKDSAQYKALIASGMNDEQIISKYNEKTAKVNAPVQPVAEQKQENIQTTPATTPTQQNTTATMPVLPDFKDDSQARQSEIIANLNKYKTENPGMMTDRNLFNQSFSYDQRSPLQKGILDNWYTNNIQKASETASLSRMASSDIALGYSNGTISDSDLSNLQQTDPAKYADIQESIKQQQSMQKYSNLLYGDEQKAQQPSIIDQMMKTMQGMMSTTASTDLYDEYEKALNSPEVTSLMNDVTDKENAVNQTDEQMNATKSELEAQFKGSGISQGRIDAIMQDQLQLLQNKKNGQILEYNAAAKKYSNKMSVIKDTMDIKEKKFQMQMQQEQSQVQKMGFMYGIYSDQQKRTDAMKASDLQFKRDVTLMNEKYEKDFNQAIKLDKLQNGDINSADPYIVDKAIGKNVDDMMKQYDGLITSSRDQLVTRIKEGIKTGKTYGAVLGEITKDIQGKPEYTQWRNNKLGIDTKPVSLGNGLIYQNGRVMSEQQFRDENNIPSAQVEAIQQSILAERIKSGGLSQYDDNSRVQALRDQYLGKDCGKQCAGYTGDIYNAITGKSISFGSTLESKINAIATIGNSAVPVVGGFVAIDTGTENGHSGYVTGVSADGKKITVLNSNYYGTASNPNNKVTENTFDISKIKAASIAPGRSAVGSGTQSGIGNFNPGDIALFNSDKYNPQTDKDAARVQRYNDYQVAKSNIYSQQDADITQLMKLSVGGKNLQSSDNKTYKDLGLVTTQLDSLIHKIQKERKTSWGGDKLKPIAGIIANNNPYDTKAADIKAQLQGIVPKIARGMFGEVGVLTDADIKNYVQTLPNIKQTADVQDVVALTLLGTLQSSMENALRVDSATYDTSGLMPQYTMIKQKVAEMKAKVLEGDGSQIKQPSSNTQSSSSALNFGFGSNNGFQGFASSFY